MNSRVPTASSGTSSHRLPGRSAASSSAHAAQISSAPASTRVRRAPAARRMSGAVARDTSTVLPDSSAAVSQPGPCSPLATNVGSASPSIIEVIAQMVLRPVSPRNGRSRSNAR
nr:hypothetical protein [Actinocatenispora thailandica]